jgi:LysM repeat protein
MSSSSSKSSSNDAPSSSSFARTNNENNTTFNRRRNAKSSSNTTRKNRFVFAYKRAALRARKDIERKGQNARNVLLETKVNFENAVIKPLFFFVPTTTVGGRRKSEEKEKTLLSKRSSKEEANWAQKDRWNALCERAIDPIKRALSSASGGVSKGGQFFTTNAEKVEGKMKSGSSVSSPAKEEVPKKNKKDEDAKRFDGFVFPLEKERKRVEERWKEVVEKMKKERMATFTSSSSSSSDARKQEEQQKNKNKNADNGKEGRSSSSLIKAKAEKMTKEVSLKLNENVSKVNAAIEARKKETEEAFTSAKRRVMAMTVKKDAERDDGKHKNKRRENNKSSTSTNSSSSNNNNNNNNSRDSENKKNKKKTATGEEPPPTNIFERSKSSASDFFGTATASMEDVKGNIESVQKSVEKKLSDMQLREDFEGTTQNIARESKKLVTEDLPSTIKTLSKESANLTGSALKEFNENIDVDVIAQNAKKSFEGTSKTVETLIRDVHSNASLAAASGKALVTDLIDPPEKMHRVRQGESLLKIARKYDVSVVDVCRVNNLAPTDENPHFVAIKIGQVLNIPNPERMAEQPAYESSKFDEKYESTVNAYYEQRLNASSSSSSKKSKVAVATSEGGGGGGGAANIRIAESSSSSSGNAKLAGSFALLATAAAISYLRAGLDDDSDDDNNDSNTNNNTTIGGGGDENTSSQML